MTELAYIRKADRPTCPVCKSTGELVYENLTDKLFGKEGFWDMKKCPKGSCYTFWLDPAPAEEDIYKLYDNYSTHDDGTLNIPNNKNSLLSKIRNSYLYNKYGYGTAPRNFIEKYLRFIAYIHPSWRDAQEANLFYVPFKNNGKLLDVGCGSGSAMVTLNNLGWKCAGIDFDEKAIANAKSKGLEVSQGDLSSQNFAEESFDAITMNHVIEHVPDPVKVLKECYRILKVGGVLTAMTPNTKSRGHKLFKENWRGLETPTHLQIFSVNSLAQVAKDAGFKNVKSFSSTQGILNIFDASKSMKYKGTFEPAIKNNLTSKIIKQLRWFIFGLLHTIAPNHDEVAVIVCRK